jgi:hypothetical protein
VGIVFEHGQHHAEHGTVPAAVRAGGVRRLPRTGAYDRVQSRQRVQSDDERAHARLEGTRAYVRRHPRAEVIERSA